MKLLEKIKNKLINAVLAVWAWLKLKAEEYEKSLQEKNNKIKEYQIQLAGIQKK